MDTVIFAPDDIHAKLGKLWKTAKNADYESFSISMDPTSQRKLHSSKAAMMDGSIDYMDGGMSWRKTAITLRLSPAELSLVTDNPVHPCEIAPNDPFCIYLTCIKRNGRIEYIDDGDTDSAYL